MKLRERERERERERDRERERQRERERERENSNLIMLESFMIEYQFNSYLIVCETILLMYYVDDSFFQAAATS